MRLAEMMEQTNTTQQALANYLGLSRSAVTQYVSGKREPDLSTLIKIAEYFSVSLDYVAGRTDGETPKSREPQNFVEINDKVIRLHNGDFLRVHIGGKTFDFTVQEIEL